MTKNSIDYNVQKVIRIGRKFLSLESVNNIACVGWKIDKFEQKEVHGGPTQNYLKNIRPYVGFLVC